MSQDLLQIVQEDFETQRQRVYLPVYFNKLASWGIVPENEKEANDLLDITSQLLARQLAKQASDESRFSEVLEELEVPHETDIAVKAAVDAFAADPELYESALRLAAAQLQVQAGM